MTYKLKEALLRTEELEKRCKDFDAMRINFDKLSQVDVVNRKLKEQKREDDFQI